MQKKRSAKEAFNGEPQPRLSAFAAAKARAAQLKAAESSSSQENVPENTAGLVENAAISGPAALSTLLSSFPLSSTHEAAAREEGDESNGAAYSSDEDIWTESSNQKSYRSTQQPRDLSSFRPSKKNVISDSPNRLVLKLKADETVTFIGEYDLTVFSGIVMVSGAAIRASEEKHRIYAPSTHALPVITAKGGAAEVAIISTGISMQGVDKLSPLFGRIWNLRDGKEGDAEGGESSGGRSFMLLRSSTDDPLKRALTPLELSPDIQVTLSRLTTKSITSVLPSVVLITGPKGSGKSTISRWLTNMLLTSSHKDAPRTSFWLDLDPGQPEFSPPGQISLTQLRAPILGPPFTHPFVHPDSTARMIRAHALAAVSPRENTPHFLSCALDLRDTYLRLRHSFPQAPLIINCSGWVLGSAVPVLLDLAGSFSPTDMVLMQPMDVEAIEALQRAVPRADVVVVPVREMRSVQSRTSAESRAMSTMSYFHSLPPAEEDEDGSATVPRNLACWDPKPMSAIRPWLVSYEGPERGIWGVLSYGEALDPALLTTVLDGMVVAVCVIEDDAAAFIEQPLYPSQQGEDEDDNDVGHNIEARIAYTPDGLPYLKPDRSGIIEPLLPGGSRCLGLAIIRGIDAVNKEIHLLTPIDEAEIADVVEGRQDEEDDEDEQKKGQKIVLVRGRFDNPEWAFLEDLYKGYADGERVNSVDRPYVAVREVGGEMGLGGHVWRVRHLPRKLGGDG